MQLSFTGRNIDVTPALKNYTTEKFQKLDRRHLGITKAHIIFQIENVTHKTEATIHISGSDIHASAEGTDMYASIDELIDKLLTQVTKHKEKLSEKH